MTLHTKITERIKKTDPAKTISDCPTGADKAQVTELELILPIIRPPVANMMQITFRTMVTSPQKPLRSFNKSATADKTPENSAFLVVDVTVVKFLVLKAIAKVDRTTVVMKATTI